MRRLLALVITLAALLAVPALFPGLTLRAAMLVERGRAGLEARSLAVAGHDLRYLAGGPEDAPVLLLLHGFGADKDNWTRMARFFTDDHRVIAPDLPGFGESTYTASASYDLGAQAARLRAFTRALALSPHHVAGNSMGGQLAGIYTATFTDAVRSVSFIDNGGITSPVPSELSRHLARGDNPLLAGSPAAYARLLDFMFVERPFIPGPVLSYFAERAITARARNEKIWKDLVARPRPLEPLLPEIRVPASILWGDEDRALHPSAIEVMRPLLSDLRQVVVMKACGHLPMIERPEETARHLRAFLDPIR